MRFIIYGAGGIGGTLGARLTQAGERVVLIARGAHLAALRLSGLHFISATQDVHLSIPAVGHPDEIDFEPGDVVFAAMKSQHTLAALDDLAAAAGTDIPLVCAQNGVANERMALRRFRNVYGMVVQLPAEHLEPGEVLNHAESPAGMIDAGCYPTGVDAIVEEMAERLTAAGFSCQPDPQVMRQKYAKLLGNLNNAVQAACVDYDPGIARLLRDEALACYAAAGIDCLSADEARARRATGVTNAPVPGRKRVGGSSWQSVARGTGDIETDYLNGEIVLLGRLHGVATPANAVVQRIGKRMVQERLAPGHFTATEITDLINEETLAQ